MTFPPLPQPKLVLVGTRRRADVVPTSGRRRADVNYRYVADVVLTSARRRRVYWVGPLAIEQKTTFGYMPGGPKSL